MHSPHFCTRDHVRRAIEGKRVALVGSGPGVLDNAPGHVDAHEVVCRVNNFKLSLQAGARTDVFYSFFGGSIRPSAEALKRQGVYLCMAKCPDAKFIESEWHTIRRKHNGVDFRYIYESRAEFWFCPTYVPSLDEFLAGFELLGRHVPTTGFSAILDLLSLNPKSLYLTGFDFFSSGVHNVNEAWRPGDPSDPIGHAPDRELKWLAENIYRQPIVADERLSQIIQAAKSTQ